MVGTCVDPTTPHEHCDIHGCVVYVCCEPVWPTEEDNAAAVARASETVRYVVTSQYRPEVRDDMYGLRDTMTGEQMCGNIWDRDNMIELAVKLNSVA